MFALKEEKKGHKTLPAMCHVVSNLFTKTALMSICLFTPSARGTAKGMCLQQCLAALPSHPTTAPPLPHHPAAARTPELEPNKHPISGKMGQDTGVGALSRCHTECQGRKDTRGADSRVSPAVTGELAQ